MWLGFLQTVMNERANQKLKDAETRKTTSKELKRLKRWEVVRRSGLLEDYGARVEEVDLSIKVPRDVDARILFRAVGDDASVDLKRIMGEQNWQTWNSMTIRHSYGETQLMLDSWRDKKAEYFARRPLHTAFIPVKQVVGVSTGRSPAASKWDAFLVLSNQRAAVAVWPIMPFSGCVVDLVAAAGSIERVRWVSIDDVEKVTIVPTRAVSPHHVARLAATH